MSRPASRLKLGFYPLPVSEARHLRSYLSFPDGQYAAVDPCIGDGAAFTALVEGTDTHAQGIEIDSLRAEQAKNLGIQVLHANTMDVHCPVDSISLLYLNPPYDFEVGATGNRRLELIFLRHTGRWLRPGGILLFIIPQKQLGACARLLAEHFTSIRVYQLTAPECRLYQQVALLAVRRKRHERLRDSALLEATRFLDGVSAKVDLPALGDETGLQYQIPASATVVLRNEGLPIDEVEDKLMESSAYRQLKRLLLREPSHIGGRPLTPLHGGHVGLLCTAGMLNGVFGKGELRHVAHWQSRKFVSRWQEEEEDGTTIVHERETFTHELALLFEDGRTEILSHEKKDNHFDSPGEPSLRET